MPGGDRTGPSGGGSQTGRGMGYCGDNDHPGNMNSQSGRGAGFGRQFRGGKGFGRGAGYGFRHGQGNFNQGFTPDVSEKTLIENDIRILKDQLSDLEERLAKTDKK